MTETTDTTDHRKLESIRETEREHGRQLSIGHQEVVAVMDLGADRVAEMEVEELQQMCGVSQRTAYRLRRIVRIAQKHT